MNLRIILLYLAVVCLIGDYVYAVNPEPCMMAHTVGGWDAVPNEETSSELCTYKPNETCCDKRTFSALGDWWTKPMGDDTEGRQARYARRLHETLYYTKSLLNWKDTLAQHALEQSNAETPDAQCKNAATLFQQFSMKKGLAKAYEKEFLACSELLQKYTTTAVCAVCDPIASTKMDKGNHTFTITEEYLNTEAKAKCANLMTMNIQSLRPYVTFVADLARCAKGKVQADRPEYKKADCPMTTTQVMDCTGNWDDVPKQEKGVYRFLKEKLGFTPISEQTTPKKADCAKFGEGLFYQSIGKVNVCALGDVDYLRGAYMNTLRALGKYEEVTFTDAQKKDDADKLKPSAEQEKEDLLEELSIPETTQSPQKEEIMRVLQIAPGQDDVLKTLDVKVSATGYDLTNSYGLDALKKTTTAELTKIDNQDIFDGLAKLSSKLLSFAVYIITLLFVFS